MTDDSSTNWYYGDYGQFASFRGKKPSQFWTDTQVIDDLKHLLSYVLNRVNTVTGIAYKDDPVILAWQFGNELGSWQKPSAPSVRLFKGCTGYPFTYIGSVVDYTNCSAP